MGKLTTMFASLLRRVGSLKRSHPSGSTPSHGLMRREEAGPKISDFEVIKPISKGAYGKIFLARKKSTGDLYAIKALRKGDLIRKNMTSYVMTERRVMALAQAPFVVKLYYAFESAEFLFLVMEYMIGGDMSSTIQERGPLEESIAAFYTAQVAEALHFLHENGIIHRDIKPDNMLLDGEGHLKLSDFGLATLSPPPTDPGDGFDDDGGDSSPGCPPPTSLTMPDGERLLGTPDYLAPEALRGGGGVGAPADWWAVGVTLFEMLAGSPPFAGQTPEQVFGNILSFKGIDWEACGGDLHFSASARDLIDRLLDPDPKLRPSGSTILRHPFFSSLQLSALRSAPGPLQPAPRDEADTSNFEGTIARAPPHPPSVLPGRKL